LAEALFTVVVPLGLYGFYIGIAALFDMVTIYRWTKTLRADWGTSSWQRKVQNPPENIPLLVSTADEDEVARRDRDWQISRHLYFGFKPLTLNRWIGFEYLLSY